MARKPYVRKIPAHRQYEPKIEAPITPALQTIMDAASASAAKQGHKLIPWKMVQGAGEMQCIRCKRLMCVAEVPIPGGPKFGGPAADEACG